VTLTLSWSNRLRNSIASRSNMMPLLTIVHCLLNGDTRHQSFLQSGVRQIGSEMAAFFCTFQIIIKDWNIYLSFIDSAKKGKVVRSLSSFRDPQVSPSYCDACLGGFGGIQSQTNSGAQYRYEQNGCQGHPYSINVPNLS